MPDKYDPDERFSLHPMSGEDVVLGLLGELPRVESLRTLAVHPGADPEQFAIVATQEQRFLTGQIPVPCLPAGGVRYEVATDCDGPLLGNELHYRFWLHHTR